MRLCPPISGLLALTAFFAAPLHAQKTLLATPTTVVWGNYDPHHAPALTVNSGDTVKIQTLSTCGPTERLHAMGVPDAEIPQYAKDIYTQFPADQKGPGGHILTGPVAIADAKPGDVLEIRIQKIDIDVPWACNSFGVGRGFLPDDFPYARTKLIRLDRDKMLADFAPGVKIPLHPFFGSMGIATPSAKTNSGPPWMNAGNMDNKELVAGTTLFLPINSDGANFEVGDGHAGQGNGEVDITALETQLTGTFQFILHKGSLADAHRLVWPRAETPTQYISMGFNEDLVRTTEMAIRNMITFLSEQNPDHPLLSREDAYALISTACDVDITQLVDMPRYGVHVMCPKNLFTTRK
ncbi:acetamidase [Granulicella sp. WH15]|uniref:acetamidase/formamidase family protein n=1 Tax=Granulicella sp. WH15 TaxID=2602070 RepID=UPI001366930C|nr:acetamidase/formamidase family protein [Granulicella sp. WH15]QHN04451.1 acetamidase [Granulicella sp. WH15]